MSGIRYHPYNKKIEISLDKSPLKSCLKSSMNVIELPEEISIKIFSYLEKRSLLESRLVCKTWNKVILSSPKLMKKILLSIDKNQIKDFSENMEISCGHQSIRFMYINDIEIPEDFIESLRRISSDVKTVKFFVCEDPEIVQEDTKLYPKYFSRCKTLELTCYGKFDSFPFFQLTKLKLVDYDALEWSCLFDFLSKQTRLSSLSLDPNCEIPSGLELPQIKCRVEDLEIIGSNDILDEKLIKFIELFGESLKSLKILDCFEECDGSAHHLVDPFTLFSSITITCKSLVKLQLSGFYFSSDFELGLDQLQPLQHVKKLSLGLIKYGTKTEMTKFLNFFPHLSEIEFIRNDIDSSNEFFQSVFRSFFDRENSKNLPAELKTIKMHHKFNYPLNHQVVKVENKFMRLTIHFETELLPLFQSNLALKLFEIFDSPKEGLMKTQHKIKDMPEWVEVTEEDFALIRRNEPYDLSVLLHFGFTLLIEKLNI